MYSDAPHPRARDACGSALLVALVACVVAAPPAAASRHHRPPPPVVAIGQPAPASMASATSVSCGDVRHCWAVGLGSGTTAAIEGTHDGGSSWSTQRVPSAVTVLAGVSCVGKLDCLAVGSTGTTGAVVATADGGQSWVPVQSPAGSAALNGVDCTAVRRCLALVTDGTSDWSALTVNRGATWTREGNLPAGMSADSITCPSASFCLAAGFDPTTAGRGAGAIATTSDGGATWAAATLPAGVGILRDVACAGATCLAAGTPSTATTGFVPAPGQLVTSSDGGVTWAITVPSVTDDDAFGVACPNAKTCVVVGTNWLGKTQPVPAGGIVATIDGGVQWRPATLRYVPVGMAAISCPAVNQCVAAGGNVLVRVALPVKPPVPKPKSHPAARAPTGVR